MYYMTQVKVAQSCPTLCDPMDCTVRGILQARILEWVVFSSPGDLPNPGIESRSPTLQGESLPAEPQGKPSSLTKMQFSSVQFSSVQSLSRARLFATP